MSGIETTEWTEENFDELSWHDNAVHALRIVEADYGAGRLILDIDFILKWRLDEPGRPLFEIAPATLEFRGVTNLRIALDYQASSAGLTPFSLDRIERRREQRERHQATLWQLAVNWPAGSITFEADGFRQFLRGPVVVSSQQHLREEDRGNGAEKQRITE